MTDSTIDSDMPPPDPIANIVPAGDAPLSSLLIDRLGLIAQTLEGTRLGILIADVGGTIEYANPALTAMSGFSRRELVAAKPRIFRSGEQDEAFYRTLWQTILGGEIWRGELVNRRKDGQLYWEQMEISPIVDAGGAITHFFAIKQDLSEKRAFLSQIENLSSFDQLTGLPNRAVFLKLMQDAIERARLLKQSLSLAYIDLDHFKSINDSLGQIQGDAILMEVTRRIEDSIRREDTLARIGSDEFVLLLNDQPAEAEVVERILKAIRAPMAIAGHTLTVTASIGVASFPLDADSGDRLLADADAANFVAKQEGRNTSRHHERRPDSGNVARSDVVQQLREVVARQELVLYYQPQLNLFSGEVIGVEALIRWQHPQRGLVPPMQFIPLAEETGLIIPISEWVLEEACRQAAEWQAAGLPAMKVGVNLSARHFRYLDLPETIRALLQCHHLQPQHLELELTESVMMHDAAAAIRIVDQLKEIGVRLSLDDFGTGYSSLAYLSRFAIDTIKIDQSFVRDITTNAINASIATATIAMAHKLGKTVIAEGVETEGQMSFLRRHECDEMQGFLFSRPIPAAELAALLTRGDKLDVHGGGTGRTAAMANRILLVDDEANILSALRRLLRREGYQIFTATSGAEGMELLAREPVSVIISDQRMPEMTGTEFLSKVKDMYPNTIRIVLSGYSEITSVTEAINRGAIYKYFSKPWDDERLKEDIRLAFREHRERFGSDAN